MIGQLARSKNNKKDLYKWQIILIVPYAIYLTVVIVVMGYSSLFAGVSLVGGAMLGMMLIKRQYVWYMFLTQIVLIFLAIISPYFGIVLPDLRRLTLNYPMLHTFSYLSYNEIMVIENAIAASVHSNEALNWESINQIQRSSTFFGVQPTYIWRYLKLFLSFMPFARYFSY